MKIAILGYSGSGKSTLAKYLSAHYRIPLLYLDTIYFEKDWKEREHHKAVSMVAGFMEQSDWVIDGNYTSFMQDERSEAADQIIYMGFNRFNCLYRCFKRYLKYRNTTRESIAEGCNEKIDLEFVWWILYKGRTKQKRKYYEFILQKYKAKSIKLKNQKQLDRFMRCIIDNETIP